MQWFKHDSSANQDVKIKKLRRKHGLMGYGLYWYIIERIQGELSLTNTSLSLEDDAEVIALDWGVNEQEIQRIMNTMLSLKLFHTNQHGQLVCPSMAKRLDASMASGDKMRKLIAALKNEHSNNHQAPIMTELVKSPDSVMAVSCKKEEKDKKDKNRIDKNILDESVHTTSEQTDTNTNHQPQQEKEKEKEVNQGSVFERALNDSARSIGGQVVPIQSRQSVKEPMTVNWSPDEGTKTRLYQKGIPGEFINETLEVFKSHYLETGQQFGSWQTKCFQWINNDWAKSAHHWQNKEQIKHSSGKATMTRLNDFSWAPQNQPTASATMTQLMDDDW